MKRIALISITALVALVVTSAVSAWTASSIIQAQVANAYGGTDNAQPQIVKVVHVQGTSEQTVGSCTDPLLEQSGDSTTTQSIHSTSALAPGHGSGHSHKLASIHNSYNNTNNNTSNTHNTATITDSFNKTAINSYNKGHGNKYTNFQDNDYSFNKDSFNTATSSSTTNNVNSNNSSNTTNTNVNSNNTYTAQSAAVDKSHSLVDIGGSNSSTAGNSVANTAVVNIATSSKVEDTGNSQSTALNI